MAGGTLASLLIKLGLDAGGVEVGVMKAQGALGRIGISSNAAGRAMAGGLALGFGALADGALTMENAAADFQASTGGTAEEARNFAKAVNEMAGSADGVGTNFQSILKAGELVRTEMGLSGAQADATTKQFLHFARATKQDVGAAVKGFDDILDAFNLTASDTPGIMDKVIYASQHGAGAVDMVETNLASMAPVLNAANLSIDDGAALLLAFGAAGVDAAAAPKALQKALIKVKSPAELKRLIDDISNTTDATDRARKAVELFGPKAGIQMAQVLKPGSKSLADYKAEIEGIGPVTDDAASALNSTFGAQFQALMGRAGSTIRGLGADFGPVLTGLASAGSLAKSLNLGPILSGVFSKAFSAVKTSGVVQAAVAGASAVHAAIYSAALKVQGAISSALEGAWGAVKRVGQAAIAAAGAAAGAIYGAAVSAATAIAGAISSAWMAIKNSSLVKGAAAAAGTVIGAIYGVASSVASNLVTAFSNAWSTIGQNAAVRGAARTAGAVVGAIYGTAAAIAAALIGALQKVWIAVRGSSVVTGAAASAGAVAGAAYAGAGAAGGFLGSFAKTVKSGLPLVMKAFAVLAVAEAANEFEPKIHKLGVDIGTNIGLGASKSNPFGFIGDFLNDANKLPWPIGTKGMPDWARIGGDAGKDTAGGMTDAMKSDLLSGAEKMGALIPPAVTAGIASGTTAGVDFFAPIRKELEKLKATAERIGASVPGAFGKGAQDHAGELRDGLMALEDILKNGLDPRKLGLQGMGAEYIEEVRKGMASKKFGAVQTAQEVALAAIAAIEQSGIGGAKGRQGLKAIGAYYDALLASGLTRNEIEAALAAKGVAADVIRKFEMQTGARAKGAAVPPAVGSGITGAQTKATTPAGAVRDAILGTLSNTAGFYTGGAAFPPAVGSGITGAQSSATTPASQTRDAILGTLSSTAGFYSGGYNVATSWGTGFIDRLNAYLYQAKISIGTLSSMIIGGSPPKTGPLKHIDKGGLNVGTAWSENFLKGIELARESVARILPTMPTSMGSLGLAVAAGTPAGTRAASQSAVSQYVAGGGSLTLQFYGPVYGGKAGLDELSRAIDDRRRQTAR